ncbi:phosphopantothenoylcysteine decarboxylase [Propionibacterium sp.]|uniref:phosphopantothenoylcysteine decarboxylase domain-containing protein n=1 Tax=Propionibacterium sp. TaxID=1977903 RepID=UPI0039E86032
MRFLITAGGTTELIDPVRRITNSATGQLGSLIAASLAAAGGQEVERIHYVCERGAVVPELDCLDLVTVRGVNQTAEAMRRLLSSEPIDAVIHSMAVSDYTVSGVTTRHEISGRLAQLAGRWAASGVPDEAQRDMELNAVLNGSAQAPSEEVKLSSGLTDLVLLMAQTPKLISLVKTLQPSTVLVGFKLLNGVSEAELLRAAGRVQQQNSCDFVLANDMTAITATQHKALLLDYGRAPEGMLADGQAAESLPGTVWKPSASPGSGAQATAEIIGRYETKQQIADGIAQAVLTRMKNVDRR